MANLDRLTDPKVALCISFNSDSYQKGEAARNQIVEEIRRMPEISEVWHTANGIDSDNFNVVVKDPAKLAQVQQKIENVRGIERVFNFR